MGDAGTVNARAVLFHFLFSFYYSFLKFLYIVLLSLLQSTTAAVARFVISVDIARDSISVAVTGLKPVVVQTSSFSVEFILH